MEILRELKGIDKSQSETLFWEGSFAKYLELVRKDHRVVRNAHTRLYHMLRAMGIARDPEGKLQYKLFSKALFGIDGALGK